MNTDGIEKLLAQQAMTTPEQKQRALEEEEKRLFGPYPSGNRHERRAALKVQGIPLPPKPKSKPVPLVQVARGPVTSQTYQRIRHAQKQGRTVIYEGRRYRVAGLVKGEDARFEARLVEAV